MSTCLSADLYYVISDVAQYPLVWLWFCPILRLSRPSPFPGTIISKIRVCGHVGFCRHVVPGTLIGGFGALLCPWFGRH
jgi:hypothetical protein